MATGSPPKLTLVADNDDAALRQRELFAELRWNTRHMVPNLLAVMSGSGRPNELAQQIIDVAAAIQGAGGKFSAEVHAELGQVLQSSMPEWCEVRSAQHLPDPPGMTGS